MFNFKDLKKQIAGIAGERQQLAREIEKKKQRRDFLMNAPLPLEEHLKRLDDLVDANAREFSFKMRDLTKSKEFKPGSPYPETTVFTMHGPGAGNIQRALCGLFRDGVKRGIREVAATWDYPDDSECGPPMTERNAEITKLDKEIADLEEKLQKLDNEAAASGIRLDGGAVPVSTAGPKVAKSKPSKFSRWLANEERPAPDDDDPSSNDDATPDEGGSDEAADTEDPKGSGVVKESAAEE